jgi:hypothetical protein
MPNSSFDRCDLQRRCCGIEQRGGADPIGGGWHEVRPLREQGLVNRKRRRGHDRGGYESSANA